MGDLTATLVPGVAGELLESPVWDERRGLLWLVDIAGRCVLGYDPARGATRKIPTPSEPGSLALAADGALVVALRDQVARLDFERGDFTLLARADHDPKTTRFNDGRCDRQGRFWVGSMYEPRDKPLAKLYRLERDRLVPVIDNIVLSNGLAFAAAGRSGFHADSPARAVWRFDLDPASGAVANRRPFVTLGPEARPDGATIDADGGYWLAAIDAGEVRRYLPDGRIACRVAVPTPWPTMIAFAGKDWRTGYITSLRHGRAPEQLARHPLSGGLFTFASDVAGVPEPRVALRTTGGSGNWLGD
jgi:sugar lactone lactonase YvrE